MFFLLLEKRLEEGTWHVEGEEPGVLGLPGTGLCCHRLKVTERGSNVQHGDCI